MGIRFRKSITVIPGVRLNISGSGTSWTIGPRGLSVNISKRGTYLNASLRGTGISFRQKIGPGFQSKPKKPKYRPSAYIPRVDPPRQENKALISLARDLGKRCGTLLRPKPPAHPLTLRCEIGKDGRFRVLNSRGALLSPAALERIIRTHGKAFHRLILTSCTRLNQPLDALGQILKDTPRPGSHPTYKPETFISPRPSPPVLRKTTLVDRLVRQRHRRIQSENLAMLAAHQKAMVSWSKDKVKFEAGEPLRRRAVETLVYHDVLVMRRVLSHRLQSIAWPLPTTSDFVLREEGRSAALTIRVSGIECLPVHYATPAPDLFSFTLRELDPALVQLHVLRYVHNVFFRAIGEVFATLPTVKVATAFCRAPGKAGASIDALIAVQVTREEWMRLDFSRLDRMDAAKQLAPYVRKSAGAAKP